MGNSCERCKKSKNVNSQNINNTTQNVIISNQLEPNSNNNISSVALNNNKNQSPLIQQGNNEMTQLIQLKNIHNELKNKFKTMMNKNKTFYKDMKKQKEYISNYKTFLNDFNHELNNYHEQLNISVLGQKLEDALTYKKDNTKLIKELDQISYKIKELNSFLETQNSELKNLEMNYKII
jgi:arsenate reductase-like glutaredoxin family protein